MKPQPELYQTNQAVVNISAPPINNPLVADFKPTIDAQYNANCNTSNTDCVKVESGHGNGRNISKSKIELINWKNGRSSHTNIDCSIDPNSMTQNAKNINSSSIESSITQSPLQPTLMHNQSANNNYDNSNSKNNHNAVFRNTMKTLMQRRQAKSQNYQQQDLKKINKYLYKLDLPTQKVDSQLDNTQSNLQIDVRIQSKNKDNFACDYQSLDRKRKEIRNHIRRKQIQTEHIKVVSMYWKRKKEAAKPIKKQVSKATIEHTLNQWRITSHHSSHTILKQCPSPQFPPPPPPSLSLHTMPNLVPSTIHRRQVYLSNITNLEQLKQSLSHSRSKFHRKPIKMEREIGREYVPFEDRVVWDGHDVGIFM